MGNLSSLIDITGILKSEVSKRDPSGGSYTKAIGEAYSKAKSISERASKYILQYPVAVSGSITDIKTALAIAKQVEFDCARFYILAAGLQPVIDYGKGDTIQAHLDALQTGAESLGYPCTIRRATDEDIRRSIENLSYIDKPYELFGRESLLAKNVYSQEIKIDNDVKVEQVEADNDESNNAVVDEGSLTGTTTQAPGGDDDSSGSTFYDIIEDEHGNQKRVYKGNSKFTPQELSASMKEGSKSVFMSPNGIDKRDLEKLGKAAPTVFTIEFIIHDIAGGRTIKVPMAIKSDLQFINREEIKRLVTEVNSPGSWLHTLIKLTSGEINFLKDWVLAAERAKKDVEAERVLGNAPISRRLIDARNRYRVKSSANAITKLVNKCKDFIAKKNYKDLPMITVVMTEQDFEEASGVRVNRVLNGSSKLVEQIIDTYMLLGFGIVDEMKDVAYFFYAGEEGYSTVKLSEMGSNGSDKDVGEKLTDVLAAMSRLITKR